MKVVAYTRFTHAAQRWGGLAYYDRFIPSVVLAHHVLYPGWELWLYTDEPTAWLRALHESGLIKLAAPPIEPVTPRLSVGMMWRLQPLFEDVEIVACRDLDALPSPRERAAVLEFEASELIVHAIHDHPSHPGGSGPLMGGMTAWRPGKVRDASGIRSLSDAMARMPGADWDQVFQDMNLMNAVLWPATRSSSMIHGFRCHRLGRSGRCRAADRRAELLPDTLPRLAERLGCDIVDLAAADAIAGHIGTAYDTQAALACYGRLAPRPLWERVLKGPLLHDQGVGWPDWHRR